MVEPAFADPSEPESVGSVTQKTDSTSNHI